METTGLWAGLGESRRGFWLELSSKSRSWYFVAHAAVVVETRQTEPHVSENRLRTFSADWRVAVGAASHDSTRQTAHVPNAEGRGAPLTLTACDRLAEHCDAIACAGSRSRTKMREWEVEAPGPLPSNVDHPRRRDQTRLTARQPQRAGPGDRESPVPPGRRFGVHANSRPASEFALLRFRGIASEGRL